MRAIPLGTVSCKASRSCSHFSHPEPGTKQQSNTIHALWDSLLENPLQLSTTCIWHELWNNNHDSPMIQPSKHYITFPYKDCSICLVLVSSFISRQQVLIISWSLHIVSQHLRLSIIQDIWLWKLTMSLEDRCHVSKFTYRNKIGASIKPVLPDFHKESHSCIWSIQIMSIFLFLRKTRCRNVA